MEGRLHRTKTENSDRHKRVLRFLRERGPRGATTREISRTCEVYGLSATISELRANNYQIDCRYERETENGRKVHRYFLVEAGQQDMFGREEIYYGEF